MAAEHRLPWLVLRVALGLQFIAAGAFSARNWSATVDFNAVLTGADLAAAATVAAVALNMVGGVSILTGVKPCHRPAYVITAGSAEVIAVSSAEVIAASSAALTA